MVCYKNDDIMVGFFILRGVDINILNKYGFICLMNVVKFVFFVKLLIEKGVNINVWEIKKMKLIVFYYFIYNESIDFFIFLLGLGVDFIIFDKYGDFFLRNVVCFL